MLAIIALVALVGLALLLYFSTSTVNHPALGFTRSALGFAVLGFGAAEVCVSIAAIEGDRDWIIGSTVAQIIGWIALLIGLKGIFTLLSARALAKRRPKSLPEKVDAPEPDLSE